MWKFILIFLVGVLRANAMQLDFLDPAQLQTKTSPPVQQTEAMKIIRKYSNDVTVEIDTNLFNDNKDVFELRTSLGQLHIKASTGVAAVWGFNYYLKKYCRSHIGWQVKHISIPNPLPEVNERIVASDRFRYYQNVCTFSYSFVWWNLTKWEEHVDWMAMNGINLVLAPVDQEAIWAKVYKSVGLTDAEIDQHFTGPAFLSWLRMGNVHGWGGPLLKSWHDHQSKVQDYVVQRMFNVGMIPVLPAFSGHVPTAFLRVYPNMTYYQTSNWNGFPDKYCCDLFVNPLDPLFKTIGKMFLTELFSNTQTSHIFSTDPFNELSVKDMSKDLIKSASEAIFSSIAEVDNQAVWVAQNWMFINSESFWTPENAKAFLSSVPIGRMLILGMQAEHYPKYDTYDMYYGQPFIWCMLHNFGGTLGMIGKMPTINAVVHSVRSRMNSTMIGIGITPEGINQNYVVYDLMLEAGWRKSPTNLNEWVEDYATRRYGCNDTSLAWRTLLHGVYSYNNTKRYGFNTYIITQAPSLDANPWAWYKIEDLFKALKVFISTPRKCNSPGFYHDLVDLVRQMLQHNAEIIYSERLKRWNEVTVNEFNASIHVYLDALHDMERILASNDDFTAVEWFESASSFAANEKENELYTLNARNQITLWGPSGEIKDYARKQWAEIFHYYYIPRWTMYLNAALEAKRTNTVFDSDKCLTEIFENIEKPFANTRIERLPKENTRKLASALYKKWKSVSGSTYSKL